MENITPAMQKYFDKLMAPMVMYVCSINGQITIEVARTLAIVRGKEDSAIKVSVTVYGKSETFGWKDIEVSIGEEDDKYFLIEQEKEAVDYANSLISKSGITFKSGMSAAATRYVQFSVIGIRWQELRRRVPRPENVPLKEYRRSLLAVWKDFEFDRHDAEYAALFYDYATYLNEL